MWVEYSDSPAQYSVATLPVLQLKWLCPSPLGGSSCPWHRRDPQLHGRGPCREWLAAHRETGTTSWDNNRETAMHPDLSGLVEPSLLLRSRQSRGPGPRS
jgi:hypothetical protein